MKELEIILLVAIAAMGILLIVLLQRITILKKQTDDIVKEVKSYLDFILEDVQIAETKKVKDTGREELSNTIIQSVLKEYFP